ncbi:hypothetical protein K353_06610 [Kitasatospora sp. SolWspMP-SS2h]|nr:hypothetical protein K353_06610 [Kitasatospora sp. SolWspMP-SS2h]
MGLVTGLRRSPVEAASADAAAGGWTKAWSGPKRRSRRMASRSHRWSRTKVRSTAWRGPRKPSTSRSPSRETAGRTRGSRGSRQFSVGVRNAVRPGPSCDQRGGCRFCRANSFVTPLVPAPSTMSGTRVHSATVDETPRSRRPPKRARPQTARPVARIKSRTGGTVRAHNSGDRWLPLRLAPVTRPVHVAGHGPRRPAAPRPTHGTSPTGGSGTGDVLSDLKEATAIAPAGKEVDCGQHLEQGADRGRPEGCGCAVVRRCSGSGAVPVCKPDLAAARRGSNRPVQRGCRCRALRAGGSWKYASCSGGGGLWPRRPGGEG